jgi:hypothetical protein
MDTILLTTTFELWDSLGHGIHCYEVWRDRKTRQWMARTPVDAAQYFCRNAGFYPAPDQNADH